MDPLLHFPDAAAITKYLSEYPLFKIDYFLEKGITKAISELAAKRFTSIKTAEMGVQMGTACLIYDLQIGKDGFTGEPLPNLGKLGLSPMIWASISRATEKALLECAKQFSK